MSKYIDANKLKRHYAWWEDGTYEMTLDEAREAFDEIIDQQPAADVAEVVRCRDCKYWVAETHGCTRHPSIEPWWETDCCSYGEKIDGGADE